MLEQMLTTVCGKIRDKPEETNNGHDTRKIIKGSLVLSKKNFMDVTNLGASFVDRVYDIFGKVVSLQLISSVHADPAHGSKGKRGKQTYLEKWNSTFTSVVAGSDATFNVTFQWDESMGVPGAFTIRNYHRHEFYLKTLILEDVPSHGHGRVVFVCNSWVYPAHRYKYDRIFFTNKAYLPSDTPELLLPYREEELVNLRGNGSGMLQEWDRVYDYAYYNDLGTPENKRPILGGSKDFPYPRRGRTGRAPTEKDQSIETRLSFLNLNIYVPRDERFSEVKFSDFIAWAIKSLGQVLIPEIGAVFDKTINEFDSFEDVLKLYDGGIELANKQTIEKLRKCIPFELLRELARNDGERFLKFPMPDVIKEDKSAWRTDEEFAREMLAGVNPVAIRRLQEFPPASTLDREIYGNQTSSITREHTEKNMDGYTVDEAIKNNWLFILDHHDGLMPYLRRINTTTTKTYATRTLLFLQDDGTLKPLAIELSLPHPQGDKYGPTSQVFTPAEYGVESSVWQLAKAYVAVNDSGFHNLISHWLNTHAVIEPFIIATNRHLSVLHPIYKLLHPHFRDTMNINALARHILINAGGVVEMTIFPQQYSMEMSAVIYKNWNFPEQALPLELVKRGVAVPDSSEPHGVRLLIQDYPYAVDGLEVWSAIKGWVNNYCCFYYKSDEIVQSDTELQAWWTELRNVGHGDLKDKKWWPQMQTVTELVDCCTIIIWVASALHAAVNFGQYPYAGYLPNRPTTSRRFMPEPGTSEYAELQSNPDVAFLKTVTPQLQTLIGISLIEALSRHSTDEVYLGQRDDPEWTLDDHPREAFKEFSNELIDIEKRIVGRNNDRRLKNRFGPVKVPYMLLYPNTSDYRREAGLTGLGIPNSTSV